MLVRWPMIRSRGEEQAKEETKEEDEEDQN